MLLLEGNATKVGPDILLNQFTKAERGNLFVPMNFRRQSLSKIKVERRFASCGTRAYFGFWVLKQLLDESGIYSHYNLP